MTDEQNTFENVVALASRSGSSLWLIFSMLCASLGVVPILWRRRLALVLAVAGTVVAGTNFATAQSQTVSVATPPTVTTSPAANVKASSASLGGTATSDGGTPVVGVGVAYSRTNMNPTPGGNDVQFTTEAPAGGAFAISVSGLTSGQTYYFRTFANNGAGFVGYGSVRTFQASPPLTLNPASPTLPGGTVGVAYSQTFTASGGSGNYTYAVTAGFVPPGLSLSTGGALSGTPTAVGSFSFTITATDNATGAAGSQQYNLSTAAPTVTLSPASLPNGTVNVSYSQQFAASGGSAPYSYAYTGGTLPPGLTLASSGTLSGRPTQTGSYTFTVTATDSSTGQGAPYTNGHNF